MKQLIGLCIGLLVLATSIDAQVTIPSRATITAELEKRDIDPVEFERRMNQKGVSLDNIDPSNPAELTRIRGVVESVMDEMSKDNVASETIIEVEPDPFARDTVETFEEAMLEEMVDDEPDVAEAVEDEEEVEERPINTWGQQIFRNNQIPLLETASATNPPDGYILGAGDKIVISIFGVSQATEAHTINTAGYIAPDGMQRIYLKGVTFGRAKTLLQKRFGQYYRFRNGEFDVTLSSPRDITVSVFGEVFNNGSFTIPARNTAFNALSATGGPTDIGSVRNIKLISGSETKTIDVYQFLLDPARQNQFYLKDNDILSVPTAEKLVAIDGAVNRPLRYELINGEGLKSLMAFAGGAKVNAALKTVQIIRTEQGQQKIITVDATSSTDYNLMDGDVVNVLEIDQAYQNFVSTSGDGFIVADDFELTRNMTVSDLIQKAGLRQDAALDDVYVERMNLDSTIYYEKVRIDLVNERWVANPEITLMPKDKILVYQQRAFSTNKTITIKGAVRKPDAYNFDQSGKFTARDLIRLAQGIQDDADDKAYIFRTDPNNRKIKSYITFSIAAAMEGTDNPTLEPDDVVTIYTTDRYVDDTYVQVEGAVRIPGDIPFGAGMALEDALNLAGGIKLEASAAKIEVIRINIDDTQSTETTVFTQTVDKSTPVLDRSSGFILAPFDNIVVREVPDFQLQEYITLTGEVVYPGNYAILRNNENLVDVIRRAGGLTSEAFPQGATMYRNTAPENGYVILDLDKALVNPKSKFNQVIKRGDVIDIPKTRGLVTMETTNTYAAELYGDELGQLDQFSVTHQPGRSVKYYLDEYVSGVNTRKGLKRKVTVRQANGRLDRTKKFLFFINSYPRVEEGSTIIVGDRPPAKEKYEDPNRERIDWGKVAVDTLSVATSAISLILLVDRLNQ